LGPGTTRPTCGHSRLVYSWSMGRIASNDDAVAFPRGLRLKRKVAAWDDDFLASLRHRMNFSPDSPASEPRIIALDRTSAATTAGPGRLAAPSIRPQDVRRGR
jgi:hypothetical protein